MVNVLKGTFADTGLTDDEGDDVEETNDAAEETDDELEEEPEGEDEETADGDEGGEESETTEGETTTEEEAPSAPVKAPPGFVPVAAVAAQREKARSLETELMALRQQYDPAYQVPEAGTPEYARYQENMIQQERINSNLNASERFARKAHGEEKVDAVKTWFETLAAENPQRAAEILTGDDPYEMAIAEYDAKTAEQQELEEYRAWKAAGKPTTPPVPPKKPVKPSEFAAKKAAEAENSPSPRKKAPPPSSLIDKPVAGGAKGSKEGPVGAGVAFHDVFGDKD